MDDAQANWAVCSEGFQNRSNLRARLDAKEVRGLAGLDAALLFRCEQEVLVERVGRNSQLHALAAAQVIVTLSALAVNFNASAVFPRTCGDPDTAGP